MSDNDARPFFRGAELSRLLLLLTLAVAGWVVVWQYWIHREVGPVEPALMADEVPEPIKADDSDDFRGVTDKTPIELLDTAAYVKLLKKARETSMADLAQQARRDVLYSHLWERPDKYRGVPVHILGTVMLSKRYDYKLAKNGWLHEVWIVTEDSHPNPIVCVFEDVPKGFPLGTDVNERVVFNGYFLKLLRYEAHRNVARAAPLLIGRIGWTPPPPGAAKGKGDSQRPVLLLMLGIGVMFAISFYRWVAGLRRTLAVRRAPSLARPRPTEEIAPEELANYLERVAPNSEDDAAENDARHE
ncbi:MAG: hypothetical protein P4L84_22845 [Isosphaeraceae bacterium]|nr:hypothetical protein [Isosphaeraceae bacterium]